MVMLGCCCLLMIVTYLGRLAQIQLFQTEDFSKHHINLLEASVRQRTQQLIIDEGRGGFLDRYGKPITYDEFTVLILFPFLRQLNWEKEKVAQILQLPVETLEKQVKEAKVPFELKHPKTEAPFSLTEEQMQQINDLEIPGVFAMIKKYPKKQHIAQHLIGITRQTNQPLHEKYPDKNVKQAAQIGISGLQLAFDEFLIAEQETKLLYHVDGEGDPLFGIDVKLLTPSNPFYPVNVQTTIDVDIQAKVEQLVDSHGVTEGGLVLLDVQTNEILAMVSRPKMNLADPYENNSIVNRMITSLPPGSIFKTVVAAAAVERGELSEGATFNCDLDIYGKKDDRELGMLTFDESFAQSCNRTFALLAKQFSKQDPQFFDTYAEKLGLLGPVGWRGDLFHFSSFQPLIREEKGQLFSKEDDRNDANFIAQTAIGQHDVRVTPLAVANMMATIARGGIQMEVMSVKGIKYKNGTTMKTLQQQRKEASISSITASRLQHLLRQVVTSEKGTGRWLASMPYEVAGKSGTAETGMFVEGRQLYHKWFAGYFPFNEPKYALVVVNMNVPEDKGSVIPLYQEVVQFLYDWDHNKPLSEPQLLE
jgi:penicillin-binding protein 4B